MKKLLFILVVSLILNSCDNSNEPNTSSSRFLYYSLVGGDEGGFYQYDFQGDIKLITKKNIVKSTQIADNGRFVFLESDTNDGGFNYYGLCEGNLLEVPKPESSEYLINIYNNDFESIPMQIDNAGHNFVYIIHKNINEETNNYFRPYAANFNCEKWEMQIIDLHKLIDENTTRDLKYVKIYPDIVTYEEYFYAIAACEFTDEVKTNHLIKFNSEFFKSFPIQVMHETKLVAVIDNEFRRMIYHFRNNEMIVEENCADSYKVVNSVDMYEFMNKTTDFNTIYDEHTILGFSSDNSFRSFNTLTGGTKNFSNVDAIAQSGTYQKKYSQVCVSSDDNYFAISFDALNSKLLLYNVENDNVEKEFMKQGTKYKVWGISGKLND